MTTQVRRMRLRELGRRGMTGTDSHEHCWHLFRGPLWLVLQDGHVPVKCCKCEAHKTVHTDHWLEGRHGS